MSSKEDRIRVRAYELWERAGRVHGAHEDHWLEATRQIEAEVSTEGGSAYVKRARKTPVADKRVLDAKSPETVAPTLKADKPAKPSRVARVPRTKATKGN